MLCFPNLMRGLFVCAIVFGFVANLSSSAYGHATDETYIWLNPKENKFDGRVEFRLEDLRKYFQMEIPDDFAAAKATILAQQSVLRGIRSPKF